jgi:large subunit ribosomal protein L13
MTIKTRNMNRAYYTSELQEKPRWRVIDAEGKVVGRLASEIAIALRGKDRPDFTPHANMNEYIIVVNAEKVVFTGDKMSEKIYNWYTGWIGGLKHVTPEELLKKDPGEIIRKAVVGMLPKNKLSRALERQLKIYAGPHHPHRAQVVTSEAAAAAA